MRKWDDKLLDYYDVSSISCTMVSEDNGILHFYQNSSELRKKSVYTCKLKRLQVDEAQEVKHHVASHLECPQQGGNLEELKMWVNEFVKDIM
jgi:hypothetical protein